MLTFSRGWSSAHVAHGITCSAEREKELNETHGSVANYEHMPNFSAIGRYMPDYIYYCGTKFCVPSFKKYVKQYVNKFQNFCMPNET